MGSKQLVTAYLTIRERIKEQRRVMAELREREKEIQLELTDYLNQNEEEGIRIDDNTIITLEQKEKKIGRGKKAYKEYLLQICSERGLEDDMFVDAILMGKTETTIQQAKLKVVKSGRKKE